MAADVTTGPQIVGTAIGALVFAGLGALCSRFWLLPRMRGWAITGKAARWQTVFSYAVWGLMAAIALVAIIVGIVAWATGTTHRHHPPHHLIDRPGSHLRVAWSPRSSG